MASSSNLEKSSEHESDSNEKLNLSDELKPPGETVKSRTTPVKTAYTCPICGSKQPSKKRAEAHIRNHAMTSNDFKCAVCDIECFAQFKLEEHLQNYHVKKNL